MPPYLTILSWIPETHMVEEEEQFLKVVSGPPHIHYGVYATFSNEYWKQRVGRRKEECLNGHQLWKRVSRSSDWTWPCYVTEDDLKLLILLPQYLKSWGQGMGEQAQLVILLSFFVLSFFFFCKYLHVFVHVCVEARSTKCLSKWFHLNLWVFWFGFCFF